MLESLLLKLLDFIITIPAVLLWILFDVIQPMLWLIIPLFIINKLMVHFFDTTLISIFMIGQSRK